MRKPWQIAIVLAFLAGPVTAQSSFDDLRKAVLTSAAEVTRVLDAHPELKAQKHEGIPLLDAALAEVIYLRRGKATPGLDVLAVLLDRGADASGLNTAGSTQLEFAVYFGDTKCAELLITKGANPNTPDNNGGVALQYAGVAASEKSANPARTLEITTLLLDKGARIDHKGRDGRSDLQMALELQEKEPDSKALKAYIDLLRSRGAK